MGPEIVINVYKIANAKIQLDALARKIQNRQIRIVFEKSQGNVPEEMKLLASNLLELGSAISQLVTKTSQVVVQVGEKFENNLDSSAGGR